MAAHVTLGLAMVVASALSLSARPTQPAISQPASSAPRSLSSGVYSDEQARRGELLYGENCAYCHGKELEGTESAPPLTAAALSARWQDKTLADLFEYQRLFMPWNRPGGFGRPQNVDILAYVLKKGGFPAGSDLPVQPDAQRAIRIVVTSRIK